MKLDYNIQPTQGFPLFPRPFKLFKKTDDQTNKKILKKSLRLKERKINRR